MTNVKWTDFLRVLCSSLRPHLDRFDRDDPISFCLNQRCVLLEFLETCLSRDSGKSLSVSSEYMREGDRTFASGCLEKSLSSYSRSIVFSPKDSEDLPRLYAKRSLVLHKLEYLAESIRDIDLAVSLGYPKGETHVLLERKAQCLMFLGEYDKAEMVLNDAMSILNELPDSEAERHVRERLKVDICKIQILKKSYKTSKIRKKRNKQELPPLEKGENQQFPSSSNSLMVLYTEEKGRYVVAKDDIKVGDVLFVEKPHSFIAFESYCTGCCEEILATIPCWNCVDVEFCSVECRDAAWKSFHKFECGFFDLLRETGIAHLALRILLQAAPTFEKVKNLTNDLAEVEKSGPISDVSFSKSQYVNLYRLQTHMSNLEIEDLLQYSLTATLLSLYITRCTEYATETDENVKFCASLLLRHTTQLICNGHAITDCKENAMRRNLSVTTERLTRIGCAVYPSVSIINHSCEASVIHSFCGSYVIVRALKDIKKGEEIFHTYGIDCHGMKRSDRQRLLQSQYHFQCTCEPCSAEYDLYEILNSFKCGKCKGALLQPSKQALSSRPQDAPPPDPRTMFCINCKNFETLPEESLNSKSRIEQLLEAGEGDQDVASALKSFTQAWTLARKVLYKFHKDLCRAADEIARCLFLLEDYERCLAFLKCSVLAVERRHGSFSIELANEARKFGDVCRYCFLSPAGIGGEPRVSFMDSGHALLLGRKYYELAARIFSTLYGKDHPQVAEIQAGMFLWGGVPSDSGSFSSRHFN